MIIHTAREFIDTDLRTYTEYTYVVEAFNYNGSASSLPITFRTPAGIPVGNLTLYVPNIASRGALFEWNEADETSGPILEYHLFSRTIDAINWTLSWTGICSIIYL